jgi:REP element-mobilizing transposase RayT
MSRPPRIPGFGYKGCYRYFLTFCTFKRQKLFVDAMTVSQTLTQFRRTSKGERFEILAYCFMPDHAHTLVEGLHDSADLCRFSKLAKQRSGGVYSRSGGGPLWQEGYYDRVLRDTEDIRQVAGYILNNPIRAGLVVTPADYPYLGSDKWTVAELMDSL